MVQAKIKDVVICKQNKHTKIDEEGKAVTSTAGQVRIPETYKVHAHKENMHLQWQRQFEQDTQHDPHAKMQMNLTTKLNHQAGSIR